MCPNNSATIYKALKRFYKIDVESLSDEVLLQTRKNFPKLSDDECRVIAAQKFIKIFCFSILPRNFAINLASFAPPPINALINVVSIGANVYYREKNFSNLIKGIYRIFGRKCPKKENFFKLKWKKNDIIRQATSRVVFVNAKKLLSSLRKEPIPKLAKTSISLTSRHMFKKKVLGLIPMGLGAGALVTYDCYQLYSFGKKLIKELSSKSK